jgi:putative DNA primase/helicase
LSAHGSQNFLPKAAVLVKGKWDKVLLHAGLDPAFFEYNRLTKKEGPCPMCGGKTRFVFYDYVETGKHYCRACGMKQSGWRLLGYLLNINDPYELSDWVRHEWANIDRIDRPATTASTFVRDPYDESAWPEVLEKYKKAWKSSKPIQEGSAAWRYRQRRCPGIGAAPDVLRAVDALDYWVSNDEETVKMTGRRFTKVGTYPGMLALVQGPSGEMVNLWRWYLTPEGEKAPVPIAKKAAGIFTTKGTYAVRLAEPVDQLAICEGVETAESVMLLKGIPAWATLSKSGMERFALPEGYERVRRVDFYGDNDAADKLGRRAGNEAARKARDKMQAAGLKSFICLPASTKYDFADIRSGAAVRLAKERA